MNDDPNESKLSPEEDLRADNELAALGLELQYGAQTFISDDAPPELIQQFLTNVAAFEKGNHGGETITVFEKLGSPGFASPDLLEAETLPGEIERVIKLLEDKDIAILKPDDLPDDVFYQFLVEEVFPLQIMDGLPPGMTICIDYDELHPNVESEIGELTEHFLLSLLYLAQPFDEDMISLSCRNEQHAITKDEALASIHGFRGRFEKFNPVGFKLEQFIEQPHGTWQMFGISWEGWPKDNSPIERHEGMGVIQFAFEDGQWLIQGVQMPGFEF
jgi:hypothetical protein